MSYQDNFFKDIYGVDIFCVAPISYARIDRSKQILTMDEGFKVTFILLVQTNLRAAKYIKINLRLDPKLFMHVYM